MPWHLPIAKSSKKKTGKTIAPAQLPYRNCVGVVLLNGAGLIFAGERIDMPGAWQMPQGGIDKGEEPLAAASRELLEETGIRDARLLQESEDWLTYDLPPELIGKAWKGRYRGQKQRWFAMAFAGDDAAINVRGVEHPEFERWQWMTPRDILEAIVPFKRTVYRRVFETFKNLTA